MNVLPGFACRGALEAPPAKAPTPGRDLARELAAEQGAHDQALGMLRAAVAERDVLLARVAEIESQLEAATAPPAKKR
jgi:hypothetical protein